MPCFRLILILTTQGLASALQLEMLESLNLRNLNLTRLHRFRLISAKDYLASIKYLPLRFSWKNVFHALHCIESQVSSPSGSHQPGHQWQQIDWWS